MKKILFVFVSFAMLTLAVTSCSKPGSTSLSDADKAEITKSTTDINQAFNPSKDVKAYVDAYYAENATILYPNIDAVKGRDAIVKALSSMGNDLNVFPTIQEIDGKGDMAYVYGTVKLESGAKVEIDHGKYIEIWEKQKDGKWQVVYDIYNTSVAMAADTTKKSQ